MQRGTRVTGWWRGGSSGAQATKVADREQVAHQFRNYLHNQIRNGGLGVARGLTCAQVFAVVDFTFAHAITKTRRYEIKTGLQRWLALVDVGCKRVAKGERAAGSTGRESSRTGKTCSSDESGPRTRVEDLWKAFVFRAMQEMGLTGDTPRCMLNAGQVSSGEFEGRFLFGRS